MAPVKRKQIELLQTRLTHLDDVVGDQITSISIYISSRTIDCYYSQIPTQAYFYDSLVRCPYMSEIVIKNQHLKTTCLLIES